MSDDLKAYNIFDLRKIALKRVPKGFFEFVDRGTEDEVSLKNNREVFDRLRFRTRTFVDVSKRTQETTIFGNKYKMPLVIAPTGVAGLLWHEGEIKLAKAARKAPSLTSLPSVKKFLSPTFPPTNLQPSPDSPSLWKASSPAP